MTTVFQWLTVTSNVKSDVVQKYSACNGMLLSYVLVWHLNCMDTILKDLMQSILYARGIFWADVFLGIISQCLGYSH